jgi:hypothetical protein
MTINMLMVMRSKIVLIRVTMVIVYLSGTPPGFSLSARFLAGRPSLGGYLKTGHPETGARLARNFLTNESGRELRITRVLRTS